MSSQNINQVPSGDVGACQLCKLELAKCECALKEGEIRQLLDKMEQLKTKTPVWKQFSNMSDILPTFDPVNQHITMEDYIFKIEEIAEMYDFDDLAICHFTLKGLKGLAKEWLDSQRVNNYTWGTLKQLLQENFPTFDSLLQRRKAAEQFIRTPDLTMQGYYYKKLALCNKADMSDEEIIEQIVDGLRNDRFRDFLGPLRKYETPAELYVNLMEAQHIGARPHNFTPRPNHFQKRPSYDWKRDAGKVSSLTTANKPKSVSTPTTSTSYKVICFKCGKEGHYARRCTETEKKSLPEKPIQHINDTHQKYFKKAILLGEEVDCYIDLGSSCTILKRDVADKLSISYLEDQNFPELTGYGGGRVKPVGATTLPIIIDGVQAKTKLYVIEPEHQMVPLLVGHSFTEQPHIVISIDSTGLTIADADIPHINQIETTASDKAIIKVANTTVIPSSYIGHVQVMTNFENAELNINGQMRETGQIIPNCIISTDHSGHSTVPMMNCSEDDFTLSAGSVLTRGEVSINHVTNSLLSRSSVNTVDIKEEEIISDEEDKTDVVALVNEFKDIVAKDSSQIGLTDKIQMTINLKTPDKTVYYRPYRLSLYEREKVADMIEDLKRAEIVEDSTSEFASPIILVRKKTGEFRLCIDFRELNKLTIKDHYPIPRIDDQLDNLGNKKYFSSLDLFSGYYQVPVDPNSRDKTAFITPDGHYQFRRMPFGLCNAPAVFQRLINKVLGNLRFSDAMAYLDDILVAAETREIALKNLRIVFELLRDSGLTINLKKCKFLMRKTNYLGFQISENGIEPDDGKIAALVNFPRPKDVRSVRSFLGLASYFRRFVQQFAVLAQPLTDLLAKGAKFAWEEEQEKSFDKIKRMLSTSPVLKVYNPKALTELHTDASSIGVGSVLLQLQDDNKLHPVAFYSRKTTKEESHYPSIELEALAIVCSLEKFRTYLLGISFIIRTDCNSLKLIEGKRDLSPRIARWFIKLSEFDYQIEYVKGSINKVADALSRNPIATDLNLVMGINITTDWVACMQRNCPEITQIRTKLENGEEMDKFILYKSRVYRNTKDRWRLYVPPDLQSELISEAHKAVAHQGIDKTLGKLKEYYYFPKMRENVTNYVMRCINCLYYKVPKGKPQGLLHPLDKGNLPFVTVHVDHLGPFNETKDKRKYVLSVIDGFSKFTWLKAVRTTEAKETANAFLEFMFSFGKPKRMITDRGTAFTGKVFANICKTYQIIHIKCASQTPRANGQVEVVNSTILTGLKTLSTGVECADWDKFLLKVQWSLNNSIHRVTKQTPADIIFRHASLGPDDNPLTEEIRLINIENGKTKLIDFDEISNLIVTDQNKQKQYFDKRRRKAEQLQEGDIVMVRCNPVSTGGSLKLETKYNGPYMVDAVLDNDRYIVKDIPGEQQTGRKYENCVAIDRIKRVPKSQSLL